MPALRAVLDTQVLLRGAAARADTITARIYEAWRAGRFTLLTSEPILHEVAAVLARPEVLAKLRMTPIEARALVMLLRHRGVIVEPSVVIRQSRDPADDKFLECAVAGGAHCLVSADADLLVLGQIRDIPILDIRAFWERIEASPAVG